MTFMKIYVVLCIMGFIVGTVDWGEDYRVQCAALSETRRWLFGWVAMRASQGLSIAIDELS